MLAAVQNLMSSHCLCKIPKIKMHRTTILPTVLNRCETQSLTPRKEHTLRVHVNRMLRSIPGCKRKEVAGG
jgi:hypothetical protein